MSDTVGRWTQRRSELRDELDRLADVLTRAEIDIGLARRLESIAARVRRHATEYEILRDLDHEIGLRAKETK